MTGSSFRWSLEEHALALAWSLWAELGVSGWVRRHQTWAIDPEPLILFTAGLGDLDPRLRDEATDWCTRYGRFVSATRLRNLLKDEPPEVQGAFAEFAATVNAHSEVAWPTRAQAREYRPSGRSALASFAGAALLPLRLRALFGVGARADVIRVFVARPEEVHATADLVPDVAYSRRNIEKALESLRLADLLEAVAVRNQLRHRLAEPASLLAFVGERPAVFPRWMAIFRSLHAFLEMAHMGEELEVEPVVRAVEAHRTFRETAGWFESADLRRPGQEIRGEAAWDTVRSWALEVSDCLARGDVRAFRRGRHAAASLD